MSIKLDKEKILKALDIDPAHLAKIEKKTSEYIMEMLGERFYWDSFAPVGDAYAVAMTDDEKYVIAYCSSADEIVVIDKETWSVVRRLPATTDTRSGFVDVLHGTHKILYNNGSAIVEHDIDTNTTTTLFSAGATECPQYHKRRTNWNRIRTGITGGTSVYIKERDGTVVTSKTLPRAMRAGSWLTDESYKIITSYSITGEDGLCYYDWTTPSTIRGDIPCQAIGNFYMLPVHVYNRGSLCTYAFEQDYGILSEMGASQPMALTFPWKSNNWFITSKYKFVGTYHFALLILDLKAVAAMPKGVNVKFGEGSVGAGASVAPSFVMGQNVKADIIVNADANVDVQVLAPVQFIGWYPSIFRRPTVPQELILDSKTGVTNYRLELTDFSVWARVKVTNPQATSTTVRILVILTGKI